MNLYWYYYFAYSIFPAFFVNTGITCIWMLNYSRHSHRHRANEYFVFSIIAECCYDFASQPPLPNGMNQQPIFTEWLPIKKAFLHIATGRLERNDFSNAVWIEETILKFFSTPFCWNSMTAIFSSSRLWIVKPLHWGIDPRENQH